MAEEFLPVPTGDRWLPLGQAARLCGVHPVTLRLWAERGLIGCIRTAGGHRRFSERQLRQLLTARAVPRDPEEPLYTHGLDYTRQRLAAAASPQALATRFDAAERERRRADGRALLGLVMHYAAQRDDDAGLLAEARRFGERYAQACQAAGMTLLDCVGMALFFRDALVESAVDTPASARLTSSERTRLVSRINQIMNAYHLGLIAAYQASDR
ncbi:MAG: helix-turn-helix domain-containing protein [Chloroflexi bacterium]|nr:helix-turn-helix domain-containing protein [Chloroflexota bacterium]